MSDAKQLEAWGFAPSTDHWHRDKWVKVAAEWEAVYCPVLGIMKLTNLKWPARFVIIPPTEPDMENILRTHHVIS